MVRTIISTLSNPHNSPKYKDQSLLGPNRREAQAIMQLPFHDPVLPTYLKALKKKHQTIRCQNYKIYFPVGTTIERSTLHRYVN